MKYELKTGRVEALCDGIFAIAMTLLIVGFDDLMKWSNAMNEDQLKMALSRMLPDMWFYLQSFIVLGAFWMEHHHQFHYITHTNLTLLLINIVAFMFVALIPFTTLIVGDYGHIRLAAMIFEVNLLLAGLAFYAHWAYAASHPGIVDSALDKRTIRFYNRKNLVIPIVSVIAIGISCFNPKVGSSIYFAVPIIIVLQRADRRS